MTFGARIWLVSKYMYGGLYCEKDFSVHYERLGAQIASRYQCGLADFTYLRNVFLSFLKETGFLTIFSFTLRYMNKEDFKRLTTNSKINLMPARGFELSLLMYIELKAAPGHSAAMVLDGVGAHCQLSLALN